MKVSANSKTVTLPEIAEKFTDGPFGSNLKSSHYVESGVRVIRLQDIGVDELINSDLAYISRDHYEDLPRNHCKPGDVIIGTMGDPNLRACVLPDDLPDSLNKADCMMLRLNRRVADPRYISKALNSDYVAHQALTLVRGQTRGRISLGRLKSLEIPLPPLAEQKRIAGILDAADALRAKRREALAQLDTLLQATFLDLFGDPVSNPKGWTEVALSDLCADPDDVRCGPFGTQLLQSEFTSSGVPLWGIKHVNAGFSFPTHEFVSESKAKKLDSYSLIPGDLVMTRKGTIGNCHIYPDGFELGIMHSDLLRLRLATSKAEPQFICSQFEFSRNIQRQLELMSPGAVMPGINVSKLKKLAVEVPPLDLQRQFVRVARTIEMQKVVHGRHLAELDTLFASLQSRAFRGEL